MTGSIICIRSHTLPKYAWKDITNTKILGYKPCQSWAKKNYCTTDPCPPSEWMWRMIIIGQDQLWWWWQRKYIIRYWFLALPLHGCSLKNVLLQLLAVQNSDLYFRAATKIMHVSHSKMTNHHEPVPHAIPFLYSLIIPELHNYPLGWTEKKLVLYNAMPIRFGFLILLMVHVSRVWHCLFHLSLCFQFKIGPEQFMGFNISAFQFFSISDALQMIKE